MAEVNGNSGYERVKAIRDEMATAILEAIEKNPKEWERGWTAVDATTPLNGKSGKAYKGFNSLYLYFMQVKRGYKDPRWVTFNQSKELGASVKKGEKASPILFYQLYDKNTKKEYNPLTVRDMSDDEKRDYMQNNVRRILKYSTVFNAEQCDNFPERKTDELPRMSEEERSRQNALIEQVIANSFAPIFYDGGNRAYYSPGRDSIHLPKIEAFHTMQDYYATALHEIAHSTGHESRLNRFGAANDVGSYAIEELRAELASTFMQRELGISISGAHFENHAAYLNSWLNAVKNDKQLFFNAVRDAEKISDYVAEHYLNAERATELDAENTKEKTPVFDAKAVFSEQVDAVLSGADTTSTHIKVSNTPKILRDVGLPNLPILITAKHLRSITQDSGTESMNYHGLGEKAIKKLPELLADPVMIMDSLTREDSVVVLTEIFDKENRPVIAAIKIDGIGRQNGEIISANILTSVYGKDNFESFLNLNLQANTVLYWNKEKSQALSVNPGIQFPDVLATLDSDIIIRKSRAFVNSSAEKSFEKADIKSKTQSEEYKIDFRLAYGNELLLSRELGAIGFRKDYSAETENEKRDEQAFEAGLNYWTNEIKYNKGEQEIVAIYGKVNKGVVIEPADIVRFTTKGMERAEVEKLVTILDGFNVKATVKSKTDEARERIEFLHAWEQTPEIERKAVKEELLHAERMDFLDDETNAKGRLAWIREYEMQREREISEAREKAHEAGLPFSSAPFDGEEDFNPYVFDGSMSVEDYKRMHDDIEAVALLNEPLYGVVYDWKGLKEENTIYTTEQLQEHMLGFDSQADLQEGAFDANKTYTVIKLNGSEETETRYKVQSFLTGKYNYAPEGIDDWYWETRSDNLFTGEANPTAEKIIQYFNLKGEELTMNESKNTNKEKNKTLKLGKEIIEVHGMYRNNLMRTYVEAKEEATTLARETHEPYLVIGKSEAPAGIKTWLNEGNILPLSEAKRIFELLNEEFKREKQKAPMRFAITYTFEGKEEFQEGLNYVFGAEKRDFQNVIEKHFRGNSNDLTRYFTRHIELNEMLHTAQAEKLPLQEQFNIQSFILAEAKIMNHAKPFTAYKPATYLDHADKSKKQEEQERKIKAKDLQAGDIVLGYDGIEEVILGAGVIFGQGKLWVDKENDWGAYGELLDADEDVVLSPHSPIRESASEAESREREDAAAREDFPNDFENEFTEALLDHFEEEQKSAGMKEPVQNAADGQERRGETLGEELSNRSVWLKIGLSEGAVGNKFGKNLLIRMPKGEYSGFGLFADAKYIKTSADGNSVLTVGDKLKYRINNDGRQVELTGAELKEVFAGKTLNKTPERVAPSKKNKAALDRLAKYVPNELKEQPCWGVYFTTAPKDQNKKKRDKVILSPNNGKWARANDPESWTDFETAMKYARAHNHEGLSLLLTKSSGITCIDLDECINTDGTYNGIAQKLTSELNGTYTEKSVSGNGLHIFIKDDVLKDGTYKSTARTEQGELEVYDSAHIISLTGNMVSKTNEITKCPTATTGFLRETLGERQKTKALVIRDANSMYRAGSDNEVIERIRKSKRGADFEALFTGKGITGNASVDDMKLANILVFFTDCDAAQSLRIMKSSASYRPDKSENYYTHTIGRAIETLSVRPTYGAGMRAGANKGGNGRGSER